MLGDTINLVAALSIRPIVEFMFLMDNGTWGKNLVKIQNVSFIVLFSEIVVYLVSEPK